MIMVLKQSISTHFAINFCCILNVQVYVNLKITAFLSGMRHCDDELPSPCVDRIQNSVRRDGHVGS